MRDRELLVLEGDLKRLWVVGDDPARLWVDREQRRRDMINSLQIWCSTVVNLPQTLKRVLQNA